MSFIRTTRTLLAAARVRLGRAVVIAPLALVIVAVLSGCGGGGGGGY
jgi:hypothetical protein